jgi:hypothetical protein
MNLNLTLIQKSIIQKNKSYLICQKKVEFLSPSHNKNLSLMTTSPGKDHLEKEKGKKKFFIFKTKNLIS